MKNTWFRWEREANTHLLYPTLEVFFKPLKKYTRVSAPTMILIFERGIVTWCIEESEFIDYGNKLLKVFKDPQKEKEMMDDIKKALVNLKQIEKDQEKLDLNNLNDDELVKLHQGLYQAFIKYYTMGAIGTPLSFSAEILLKEKGLSDEELNMLTTPDEISYVKEADDYLLATKDIKGFKIKYFWIDNNYSGTKVISVKEVERRLKNLTNDINKQTPEVSKRTSGVSVNDDKEVVRLIELLKNYSTYKDNRKKEILIYLHYVDSVLKEVSRRTGLSTDKVRASLPSEIGDVLNGKLTKVELDKRLDYFVIVWEKDTKKPLLLTGQEGKKWEQKTLQKSDNSNIIHGRTACPGKVTGKVRILLKAEDCDQLQNGEVLVTFMTSPDFMPAIRKSAAIVTNLGGVTSHAAIISRELNIPCIVGTKIATQILKTGDLIEVDANQGIVVKLS